MINFSVLSSFFLGALHSLEPGHGKSIVALHTSQSRKLSDGISLLASLLLTHFLLTLIVSVVLYLNPQWAQYQWIQIAAPFLIIFYGLFLLVKSKRNTDEYLACNCSHTEENSKSKNPMLMGVLAGLTPCPSVFAPIIICLSTQNFEEIFVYLLSYMMGVVSIFLTIFFGVFFLKKQSPDIEKFLNKFNPHLISGSILVLVGVIYLAVGFFHHAH